MLHCRLPALDSHTTASPLTHCKLHISKSACRRRPCHSQRSLLRPGRGSSRDSSCAACSNLLAVHLRPAGSDAAGPQQQDWIPAACSCMQLSANGVPLPGCQRCSAPPARHSRNAPPPAAADRRRPCSALHPRTAPKVHQGGGAPPPPTPSTTCTASCAAHHSQL